MPPAAPAGLRALRPGLAWVVGGSLFGMILLVVVLVLTDRIVWKATEYRRAPLDNVEWTAAQVETELLRLLLETRRAARDAETGLDEVRKRFDIFYSRVDVVEEGRSFAALRADPEAAENISRLHGFLDRTAPVVDGPDDVLRRALPALADELRDLHEPTRELVLQGVELYAARADEERGKFASHLSFAANTILGVIIALVLYSLILLWQFRLTRHREAQLRRSGERLEATVNSALDAVVAMDGAGRIIEFNPAAEKVFGYTRDEAVGQQMHQLIVPPEHRGSHLAGFRRHLKTGEGTVVGKGRLELTALNAAGEVFPVELAVGRAVGEDGPIFIAYLRDITERKRVEHELTRARDRAEAADQAKSDFLAVMSHEMRTPLNGLLGALDLLQATDPDPRQAQHIRLAATAGELLLCHVNDVLDLTKVEAGKMDLLKRPFALANLVHETCEIVKEEALRRDNRVTFELAPDLPGALLGDDRRLRQVLLNILSNAAKFTDEGHILLAVRRVGGSDALPLLEFSVRDTGIGISEEGVRRLFQDFVVLNPSYSREVGGTGLGLAISRRLVELMGGEIGVESRQGEGSRFWFRLPMPVTENVGDPAVDQHRSAVSTAPSLRVLLVEDNDISRRVAEQMLTAGGCTVTVAPDGFVAVDEAEGAEFDVILMDISMPRMDGIEATCRIRNGGGKSANAIIIGVTAHAQPTETERFIRAGMEACLTKPLRLAELYRTLAETQQATEADPKPAAEGLDPAEMQVIAAGLPDGFLHEMLDQFERELAEQGPRLSAAAQTSDTETLARLAHALHGAAASVGARSLAELLAEVETASKSGDAQTSRLHLSQIERLSAAISRDISELNRSRKAREPAEAETFDLRVPNHTPH